MYKNRSTQASEHNRFPLWLLECFAGRFFGDFNRFVQASDDHRFGLLGSFIAITIACIKSEITESLSFLLVFAGILISCKMR